MFVTGIYTPIHYIHTTYILLITFTFALTNCISNIPFAELKGLKIFDPALNKMFHLHHSHPRKLSMGRVFH